MSRRPFDLEVTEVEDRGDHKLVTVEGVQGISTTNAGIENKAKMNAVRAVGLSTFGIRDVGNIAEVQSHETIEEGVIEAPGLKPSDKKRIVVKI